MYVYLILIYIYILIYREVKAGRAPLIFKIHAATVGVSAAPIAPVAHGLLEHVDNLPTQHRFTLSSIAYKTGGARREGAHRAPLLEQRAIGGTMG